MSDQIIQVNDEAGDIDKAIMADKIKQFDMKDVPKMEVSKSELEKFDQATSALEMTPAQREEALRNSIEPALQQYNERYGTKINYEDLQTAIQYAITGTASDKEIKSIINSDLIFNSTNYLVFKTILAITKTVNEMLNDFVSSSANRQFTGENVAILEQIFGWLDKLEAIKQRYKISDVDKVLRNSMRGNKSVVRSEKETLLINTLKESLMEDSK